MRTTKRQVSLPIGRTARITYEIDEARGICSRAASQLLDSDNCDPAELEDCARLEEALAQAQRALKAAVGSAIFSRIARYSANSE